MIEGAKKDGIDSKRHQTSGPDGRVSILARWPRDATAPRTCIDSKREGDGSLERGFKFDLYDLVADGRGWSW